MPLEIRVSPSVDGATQAAAELLAKATERGGHVALSGGSTPRPAYEAAARLKSDWSRVEPIAYGGWIYSGLIAAGISNVVMSDGIRVLGPARAVAFQFLVPLFAVLIGASILAEPIRPDQVRDRAAVQRRFHQLRLFLLVDLQRPHRR